MLHVLANIDVADLARAETFYTAALGLRVGRRFGDAAVELLGAEIPVYLIAAGEGTAPFAGASGLRTYGRHWTPVHLDLVVDDIELAVRRAVKAGAEVEVPVAQRGYGKLAVLADPFGNGFCFLQFEGRGYDGVATGSG